MEIWGNGHFGEIGTLGLMGIGANWHFGVWESVLECGGGDWRCGGCG